MIVNNQKTTGLWRKISLILLACYLSFGIVQIAGAESAETEIKLAEEPHQKILVIKDAEVSEAESFDTSLQKAKEKVESVLKEKGDNSIEITEARLDLARLELKSLIERGDLQRFGALMSLKKEKVKVLENLLQRKAAAERSRAEAEKSRIEAEILKRELAQEIKELAQEQKELAQVRKEEVQALEEEAQAKTELNDVIRQLNQKIKELNRKVR